jgi:hypothetical protein
MDIDKSKKVNYVIDVAALLWRRYACLFEMQAKAYY